MNAKTLLQRLLAPAARKNRLPGGRCSCHEASVRWCTRHGQPLRNAQRRAHELALT